MPTRASLEFQARRIGSSLRTVFNNKMAALGISILIFFAFLALVGPSLTPYGPRQPVSGPLAQPEWVLNFPDGYYLSKNLAVVPDSSFTTPGTVEDWSLLASHSTLAQLQLSYSRAITMPGNSGGSLSISYTGTQSGNVTIERAFDYPYHGPPSSIDASVSIFSPKDATGRPVHVRLFIDRVDQLFYIASLYLNRTGTWQTFTFGSADIGTQLGLTSTAGFGAQQIIFSSAQVYKFGLEVVFPGPGSVYLDNLQFSTIGTAFGLLGTTNSGADVATDVTYGARISLEVGLLAAAIGIGLGLLIGLMAGFLGKFVDELLMRFTDMMLVIPGLPLLIVLAAVLGPNIVNLIIIIGFLGWMGFARIIRSQVLSLRERPFVEAAKAAGAGNWRIMGRHIFPNIVSLTYVNLALAVPGAILVEAAVEFLGLGDPYVVSWGNMFQQIETSGALSVKPPVWWWVIPPGLGIALVSLSFVLIGYALDEIFNPRLRRRR